MVGHSELQPLLACTFAKRDRRRAAALGRNRQPDFTN
jgi:hypothetical protein